APPTSPAPGRTEPDRCTPRPPVSRLRSCGRARHTSPTPGVPTYSGTMLIRLGGLFFLISLIFWLWALFDSATAEPARVRSLPKLLWFVVILLLFEVGAL